MSTRTPTDRPRGAARREALLEAVLQIVADVGAEAVTHRRVAEVAGLPLASTTYWFESKDELLTAALQLAADRDVERLTELLAARPDDTDPRDAVLAAVLGPQSEPWNRASLLATYALLLEAARRPALQELSRRWTDAYVDAIGPLLQRAGSKQPHQDATLVLAAADGLLLEALTVGDDDGDPRPEIRRLLDALLSASR